MRKYTIKVRLRKGSLLSNIPFYDTYTYVAINAHEALELMREQVWRDYECFNPEVISVCGTEV